MEINEENLLKLVGGKNNPTPEEFRSLISKIDSHQILAKVFLLEGIPYVFQTSPMKYLIFREQVAERFSVGSRDVCIVGSAKLGYSPSPGKKFGRAFSETSDVDVVIISEKIFHQGSSELFRSIHELEPQVNIVRSFFETKKTQEPTVDLRDWLKVKDVIRNYIYENFNPGLLPDDNPLRNSIFDRITSTAGLFLALEPQVFVSKIRARIFRTWRSAEDYYTNSLRQLKYAFQGAQAIGDDDMDDFTSIPSPEKGESLESTPNSNDSVSKK